MSHDRLGSSPQTTEEPLRTDEYSEIAWGVLPLYVGSSIRAILDDMAIEDATYSPDEMDQIRRAVISDVGYTIDLVNRTNVHDKVNPRRLAGGLLDLAQIRLDEENHEIGTHLLMLGDVISAIARPKSRKQK